MNLVDEIITLSSSESASVSTLLRKCLVLAYTLHNDRLKTWAENELNGYEGEGVEVPAYRKATAQAKGLFLGPFGASIDNQPIPAEALKEHHRHWAREIILGQPIAAYEGAEPDSRMAFAWPAGLTILYERTFFEGRYALNRAWQEVPGSVVVGLIDTIKTRVLRFALELKEELADVHNDLAEVPKERVEQTVNTYIYGGTNVIASRDFTQIGNIEIIQDDWIALSNALTNTLGVAPASIAELKNSLDADAKETPHGLGSRTAQWLKDFGKETGQAALKVGVEVAKKEMMKWISGYLGLPT